MRELSLFSGAGGGLLGTKLLGFEHVGYVEYDDYCQRVIRARIDDGYLDDAPIFGDIRTFIEEGYADAYSGMVDVVTAGFPCQPFSVAGKQKGEQDERNMWPATLDVLLRVRPRYALLENVPGLLAHEYAKRIFGDLAEAGYDCRWRVLSAAECGAPHKRDRVWIVAERNHAGQRSDSGGRCSREASETGDNVGGVCANVADALQRVGKSNRDTPGVGRESKPVPRDTVSWWATEPDVGRVANGVASRVDRLKALGNGQVPIVAATAWRLLA